ncbi:MAG: hypothetical protein ABJM26_02560 [Anderseniella sp.]
MSIDYEPRELNRKEEELSRLLEEIKQQDLDCASSRNEARSLTDIDLVLGRYKEKPPKWVPGKSLCMREWSPEKSKDFAIETRRDGLHARYNTDSILTRLKRFDRVESSLVRIEMQVMLCLVVLSVLVFMLAFDVKLPVSG